MKMHFLFHFLLLMIVNNVQAIDMEHTGQVITVERGSTGDFQGLVRCYEKIQEGWEEIYAFRAVTGRTGIVEPERKREGDEATPSGIYRLESVFGYDKEADTRMEYRELSDDDKWVDDPEHPMYNRLVTGKTEDNYCCGDNANHVFIIVLWAPNSQQ